MPRSYFVVTPWSVELRACSVLLLAICLAPGVRGAEPIPAEALGRRFVERVKPFLESHCLGCHGDVRHEAELNLSGYSSIDDVAKGHSTWQIVLERLEAHEMPPEDAERQPDQADRSAVIDWIRALQKHEAHRTAGDPGPVLARRLSNAEYNYTVRDLTHVDIQPAKTFPVDPANEAGFDNSGESLSMSPALVQKYLDAARHVADHLVLTAQGLSFAPHPVITDTDRDKYCVKRIIEFYGKQPTDLSQYFFVCWQHRRNAWRFAQDPNTTARHGLSELAERAEISVPYTARIGELLDEQEAVGPIARLQEMFRAISVTADDASVASDCQKMSEYVLGLRTQLAPKFENLVIPGSHKGSQPFVLWKNGQYAAHRRTFDRDALYVEDDEIPHGTSPELVLPKEQANQARHLASIERFCSVFPDAFYISERGRDYLKVPREQQEKGRLLSAGFHSMTGYYRDDRPLYELILDEDGRRTLDRLWRDFDYVTSAPARQYLSFLWFERTDSRYMRDPEFDFARAEDKHATSAEMIHRLAEVYLDKTRRNGGSEVAVKAIADYFDTIDDQIRQVEAQRSQAEAIHLKLLIQFAQRSWRRALSPEDEEELRRFYSLVRDADRLDHEDAIRDTIVSILMSPHFLYRMDLASGSGGGSRRLADFEVASQLSYFLWSTLPDRELLRLVDAPGDRLADPEFVAAQAMRMLNDEKVRGLATEFAANWLDFRRFEEHNSVDRDRFPEFSDELRQSMFEEPIRFFVDLVQRDRSVLELLYADHTFVDSMLAEHYGIEHFDLSAGEWQRVDDAHRYDRGGLLPMSVFLTKNAPGLRTSPVKRGYWVVRRLLGERIPPPPPNVPELPADESKLGDISLREMLARHRSDKRCAGCHDRFDSIGLAFEGYGPTGQRRVKDLGGRPVQIDVDFPSGDTGRGLVGLREYLREHREEEFLDNLCRKLLSYALGRTLLLSDEPLIADMNAKLADAEYRFSSLIRSIVTSRQFLTKRGTKRLVEDN